MPILSNARHERFAQELAKGLVPEDAYQAAGFKPARQNAHRLMTKDDVRARVEELKQRAAADVQVSREWVLEQLIDNAAKAKQAGDFGPSNQALNLIGKELGMFVERSENVNINHDVSDQPLSEDEWEAQHARAH